MGPGLGPNLRSVSLQRLTFSFHHFASLRLSLFDKIGYIQGGMAIDKADFIWNKTCWLC